MPRVTRVPGHTTLTPSPLMRRKPQHVTLAADLVDRAGSNAALTTPPRATSPTSGAISASMSNTLSPNTRLTKMVHEGTVTIGGVGGGPLAAITTLKSDLVMLQSEIDATVGSGGRGGALELQSTLARFGGSADERTNLETCNTLLSLVLLKINELCRLHGSLPATAPRQSRVGDVVSLFRGLRTGDRNADAGVAGHDALLLQARSPSQRPSVSSSSQAVVAGLAAPRSSNTHRAASTSDMVEDIAWDIPSSQPHHRRVASGHLDMSSDPPSPTAGLSRAVTSGGMPIPLHEAQRKASGSLAEGSITKYPTQQQPAARAAGSNTSPGLPASPRSSPAPAVTATAPTLPHDVRAHIARLEKQLQLFKYLERAMHVVDTFDNTMKHCTMNESLKELGIDMAQLMSSAKITLPPHTVTKAGVFRSAVTVRPPAGSPAGGLVSGESAPSPSMASSSPQHASSPEASVNPLTNNTLTSAGGGDDGSVTDGLPLMPETQAVATLKALISFQNAVVSLLLAEMKAQKAAQQHQLAEFVGGGQAIAPLDLERSPSPGLTASLTMVSPRELSDKIKRLEDALAQRNEQIAAERQLHFLRHERAANVILAERARSSTPGAGASRPNTTLTSLSSMEWSRPATTNVVARTLALPPVPSSVSPIGAPSPIPILATRPEDVPGATELIFRKTIAQQGEIIKDLQRRVATPDVGTRGGAALQQPSAKATVL